MKSIKEKVLESIDMYQILHGLNLYHGLSSHSDSNHIVFFLKKIFHLLYNDVLYPNGIIIENISVDSSGYIGFKVLGRKFFLHYLKCNENDGGFSKNKFLNIIELYPLDYDYRRLTEYSSYCITAVNLDSWDQNSADMLWKWFKNSPKIEEPIEHEQWESFQNVI